MALKVCPVAKDLQWFKFSPLDWMTGRIRREPIKVQIAFLELMCQYWKNDCSMTIQQAELEVDCLPQLMKKKIIKTDGEFIRIHFLDVQMDSIDETSVKRSNAAKERWKEKHNAPMQVHTSALLLKNTPMQTDAEKRREEKTRVERENYTHAKEAFEDITKNYLETEPQRNIIKNKGWTSATEKDINALLYHYLELQGDLTLRTKSDIKKHFRSWLNKYDVIELQKISKQIHERLSTKVS